MYNFVSSVAVAFDGAVWFGTDGLGVSRFDGETWTTFTVLDGLASNNILAIAPVSDGSLLFATAGAGVSHYMAHPESD